MDLQYSKAEKDDVEIIYQFECELVDAYEDKDAIAYDKVMAWIHNKISENIGEYTRVSLEGRPVAWFRFVPSEGRMEMDDLYVLPEFRNRGIGTKILEKCCSDTDLPVFLYVFRKNVGAVSLYERMGFRVIEEVGRTRYIMQRDNRT